MKVSELIKKLNKVNENCEVIISTFDKDDRCVNLSKIDVVISDSVVVTIQNSIEGRVIDRRVL